ncbi:hypothetical protein CBM2614_A10047 [Cupriavidus taiwanensis]|uniref:Uncharacterized protein n=1 Tax=Cupriavidus taiwanensis TaxID=164546 RepID=A0A976ASV1_9BURK|nr:hypothetical protein CBM2614_A10047 [Cupriavidus taiwanensis]SOZ51608.1 hypothetical protein CBM2613_A10046 [Cupriavidus taiwanensis]
MLETDCEFCQKPAVVLTGSFKVNAFVPALLIDNPRGRSKVVWTSSLNALNTPRMSWVGRGAAMLFLLYLFFRNETHADYTMPVNRST